MSSNLKRLTLDLISFITIGIFSQIFIRLSYLNRVAQEYLGDDYNSDTYNNFSQNPIIDGFSGFFNFFSGEWGNSLYRGQPILKILYPGFEHGLLLVQYLIIGVIFGFILPYIIIKIDQNRVTQIFNSYLPIAIISVIYLAMFLNDPSPYVFSGFRDRNFDENHPGAQLLIQLTNFLIIGMMTKKFLQLHHDFSYNNKKSNTLELILRGLKSQLNYIFMIWITISYVLNLPIAARYWIYTALNYDYSLFIALFMSYLVIYYLIVILVDVILVFVSDSSTSSLTFRSVDIISQPQWKKLLILTFGVFILVITLGGLFAFSEYMSNSSQLSLINSTEPVDVGNTNHILGTNQDGFNNLVLLSVYFLIITLIVSLQVLLFLVCKKYLNQYISRESLLPKFLFDYTKSFPSFLILGITFVLFINPSPNIFITTLILFILTFPLSLKAIIPIINSSSTFTSKVIINVGAVSYTITFLNLLYAGFFNYSKSYLYSNIITSLATENQYEFFYWFTLAIILFLLFISSTSIIFGNQDDAELYPTSK